MGAAEELERCRCELYRVLIENAALKYSAQSFGDLAERLNLRLKRTRRAETRAPSTEPDPPYDSL
jgi:hypothetical protein